MSDRRNFAEALTSLVGCRVVAIGRAANMVVLEFSTGDDDAPVRKIHAQCPFRATRGDQILLGSFDMHWPQDRSTDRTTAFDSFTTMYERNGKGLQELLNSAKVKILAAVLGMAGHITIQLSESVVFEVCPASSGPHEQWRLIDDIGEHYVYPEDFR